MVTLGNSWLFSYNFFTDVPPSDTADRVAVVSLWTLPLRGDCCDNHVRRVLLARAGSILGSEALKASLRALKHDGWWAVPSMIIAAISVVLIAPALYVVGVLSAVTVTRLSDQPTPLGYFPLRARSTTIGGLATAGCPR